MQNKKRNFEEKLKILIDVFNIPLQEKWEKYLKDDYYNFFFYFDGLEVIEKNNFTYGKPETYKIEYNKFIQKYFFKNEYYFETGDLTGKKIVDVGCGWGILTIWYALSGAKEIYAIGFAYQIEFINRLIKRAKERKILDDSINIKAIAQPLEKNITKIGNLEFRSVECVYYNDVFEHLPDNIFMDALIASYNILKKGGKLISLTHNTNNPFVLKRAKDWWTKVENESFISYRANIIKEKVSDISGENLEKMAASTRGLLTGDFYKAIYDFQTTGDIPEPQKLMPAVNLTIDYICENYISPPDVVNMMSDSGFKAHCYAALMHSRRLAIFQPLATIFKSLFMNINAFSQNVVFVGKKQ
ncbi:MAG: class I SAM-dependent methyltransferase [Bacteroidota bacterium]